MHAQMHDIISFVRALFGDWFFTKKVAAKSFCANAFELKKGSAAFWHNCRNI
jgi:hypothetical protein